MGVSNHAGTSKSSVYCTRVYKYIYPPFTLLSSGDTWSLRQTIPLVFLRPRIIHQSPMLSLWSIMLFRWLRHFNLRFLLFCTGDWQMDITLDIIPHGHNYASSDCLRDVRQLRVRIGFRNLHHTYKGISHTFTFVLTTRTPMSLGL